MRVAAEVDVAPATVRDVSEVLDELGPPRAPRGRIEARVVYHDACHLAHGQGVRSQPRVMLQAIPGLEDVTIVAWSQNCTQCHGQLGRGDGPRGPMLKATN